MSKEYLNEIVQYFIEQIKIQGVKINKIILFGSYSRNNANSESDIDLVVVSNDFTGKDIFTKTKLMNGADAKTIKKYLVPLDVILMSPEELENESSLISGYAREGTVLYSEN